MTERTSPQIDKLAFALVAYHTHNPKLLLDSENPYFHSRYASLHAIIDATTNALVKCGLSIVQCPNMDGLETWLIHTSGQYIMSSTMVRSKDMTDPQKLGSALTYARRYGYAAMLSLAADPDDDANAASDKKEETVKQARKEEAIKSAKDEIKTKKDSYDDKLI